jgi:SAM-dependent methyltransferase
VESTVAVSTLSYARVGPVHFQPIEWELNPITQYVGGRALNAGCGYRDITRLLQGMGASEVTNCDIATDIPGATLCSLDTLPFDDASFDTILCNAVLEHVVSVEAVMASLVRVLRPGGHLIVTIPFLQPYHEAPRDFRRFTKEGMTQLAEQSGLEVRALLPVHTIAQTLGWILWEYLLDNDKRVMQRLCYPVIWYFTRRRCRSDLASTRSANTFQGVFRKPL